MSCVTNVALFARSRMIGKIAVIRSRPFGGSSPRDRAAIRFRLVRLLGRIIAAKTNVFFLSLRFVTYLLCALS